MRKIDNNNTNNKSYACDFAHICFNIYLYSTAYSALDKKSIKPKKLARRYILKQVHSYSLDSEPFLFAPFTLPIVNVP